MGAEVGRGGEGSVYEVDGDSRRCVAKVYHKRPLAEDQVAKLQAMVCLLVERARDDLRLAAVAAVRSDRRASRAAS